MIEQTLSSPVTATYRYQALPTQVAEQIRATLSDAAGNALQVWLSDEHGNPCRHCLQMTAPGDRLIVFAYSPFDRTGPYVESGPIFIHAEPCPRYVDTGRLPAAFEARPLTLRAYGETTRGFAIVDAEVAAPHDAANALARLFADERVTYVHARNPAWGCYDFRIERARR